MLYLIEDRDYLKIGYTNNLEQRFKAYELHNCYARVINVKKGTRADELVLLNLCKDYQYKGEWFFNCSEVKQIFNTFISNLDQFIKDLSIYVNKRAHLINVNWIGYRLKSYTELKQLDAKYSEFKNRNKIKEYLVDANEKLDLWFYLTAQDKLAYIDPNFTKCGLDKTYQINKDIIIST